MSKNGAWETGRSIEDDGRVSNWSPEVTQTMLIETGTMKEKQFEGGGGDHKVISGKIPKTVLLDEFYRWGSLLDQRR